MNNKKGVLILLILCLLPIVSAFELTSLENSASTCQGSTTLFTANVIGSGAFTVSLDGTASSWAVVVPQGFLINNQNKIIYIYITSPSLALPGGYTLNLIVSNGAETKTVNYNLNINDCHNLVLTGELSKAICACNQETYSFNLLNSGIYQENYNLEIQGAAEDWLTLSQDSITLAPNEQKTVYAYAEIPCNIQPKNYGFTFATSNQYLTSSIDSNADVTNCFDFELTTNKDYLSMCDNSVETIDININNFGSSTNKFFLELDGPSFANLENNELTIDGLQLKKTTLILSPEYNLEGGFNAKIKARSDYGEIEKQKEISIDVRKCNLVSLQILDEGDKICSALTKNYQVNIKNIGEVPKELKLETSEVWASLDADIIELAPNEEINLNLEITPPSETFGNKKIYVRALALDSTQASNEDYLDLEVFSSGDCYKPNIESEDSIEIFQDSGATLPVVIGNMGSQPADYSIAISGTSSNFVQLNPATLGLEPQKSEIIYLYIAPSNYVAPGTYKTTISVIKDEIILKSKTITIEVKKAEGITQEEEPSINFFTKLKNWFIGLFSVPMVFSEEKLVTKNTDFIYNNEQHKLKIEEVGEDYATISIESEPLIDTLNVGETKDFDVNNDGVFDITITLDSIINGAPQLRVVEIKPEIEEELEEISSEIEEEPIDNLEDVTENIEENITTKEPIINFNFFDQYKMYFLYGLIGLIIIAFIFLLYKGLSISSEKKEEDKEEEEESEEKPLRLGRWILGLIIIGVLVYLGYKYKWIDILKEFFIKCYGYGALGFSYVGVYKYYILIGLVILLIIILLMKYWSHIIDFFEEEEEEEKPKRKKKKKS